MNWFKHTIEIRSSGKGLYAITDKVTALIRNWGIREGMCFLYMPHTSASLLINENYDPSVQADIETFLEKTIPENQPWMQHTLEGGDDSSSHLRAALLPTSLSIPIEGGLLALGTWQGIYLVEHRRVAHRRNVEVRMFSIE